MGGIKRDTWKEIVVHFGDRPGGLPCHFTLNFVEASARESSEKETMCRVRCLIRLHFLVKCRVVLRCNSADEQKEELLNWRDMFRNLAVIKELCD